MATTGNQVLGALAPRTRLHEYEILGVLGHGGFGITYLARDHHLDKKFAIKEYLPSELAARDDSQSVTVRTPDSREAFEWGRDQFLKEARVLARFNHPNLIEVHRFFEANQTAYFVMEFADGVTLEQILRQEKTISEQRLRQIIEPILDGLEVVHQAGILHRDIKPGNIILRSDGTSVLIDFGAARFTLGTMTRSTLNLVTAGYAPVEQYSTTGQQGPWTDLYALGAVCYRSITGRRPPDSINRLREDPLEPAARIGQGKASAAFLAAMDWAMSVYEKDRPQSVAEWRAALGGAATMPSTASAPAAKSAPVSVVATTPIEATEIVSKRVLRELPTTAPQGPAQKTWLSWAATLLVLVVIAETAWLLWSGREVKVEPPLAQPPVQIVAAPEPVVQEPAAAEPINSSPVPAASVASRSATAGTMSLEAVAKELAANANPQAPTLATVPSRTQPQPASPATKKSPPQAQEKEAKPAASKIKPLSSMAALSVFKDCPECPSMVVIPAGRFTMGAGAVAAWEKPPHMVQIGASFAIGRTEVTGDEWTACVKAGRCAPNNSAQGKLPVVLVDAAAAQAYAAWLSQKTGRRYRLPTEAEWEYAGRGGTASSRYWGEERKEQCRYANGADLSAQRKLTQGTLIADCDDAFPARAPAGRLLPNAYGLFDMPGNVWEWVQDCWSDNYAGAPTRGEAVLRPNCKERVTRGGSWSTKPESLRSAARGRSLAGHKGNDLGLRVAAD